ncbi:MAG: hypothetical protein L0226_15110 [Acidobacteria bacterium]|nr:hypothetical protein [Acidobacteriota bacterium]MCI0661995.1 hypothetical protein [Acidobacteriota bacterium]
MSAVEIIQTFRNARASLLPDGDDLIVDGPESFLTQEMIEQIRTCKAELLQLLTKPETPSENLEMHDSALIADEPVKVCPICTGPVTVQRGKRFVHLRCPVGGHFDSWRAFGGRKLRDTDAPLIDRNGEYK